MSGLSVAAGSSTAGGSEVSVKTMEKGAATAKVEMTVTPAETVRSVKEKVAAAQLIAFPEHKLVCGGEKLDEKKTLGDCGVTEASAVEFVLEATEDSVVTQLKELSLIHISEPTRLRRISYAVFCLKKKTEMLCTLTK